MAVARPLTALHLIFRDCGDEPPPAFECVARSADGEQRANLNAGNGGDAHTVFLCTRRQSVGHGGRSRGESGSGTGSGS
jgi:hypothetical protein